MTTDVRPQNNKPTKSPVAASLIARKMQFGSHGLRVGWRLLIYFGVLIFCVVVSIEATRALLRVLHWHLSNHPPHTESVESLLVSQTLILVSALVATTVMAKIEKRSLTDYWIPRKGAFGRKFCEGLVWGLAVSAGIVLLIWIGHGYSFGSLALSGRQLISYSLLWAAAALINGFGENLAILGYPLFTLASAIRFWPAAILLTGIFTAGHFTNPGEYSVGLVSISLQCLFLCFTICRTGDLWFSIGLHAGGIFAEDFLLSAPDSGTIYTGHLLNSSFHGPRWLTGGSVGPEASVMAFLVLASALFLFDRIHCKRR